MSKRVRNFLALHGAYLLLRFVATAEVRERAESALRKGLKADGLVDLTGTRARIDPLAFLKDAA